MPEGIPTGTPAIGKVPSSKHKLPGISGLPTRERGASTGSKKPCQ